MKALLSMTLMAIATLTVTGCSSNTLSLAKNEARPATAYCFDGGVVVDDGTKLIVVEEMVNIEILCD